MRAQPATETEPRLISRGDLLGRAGALWFAVLSQCGSESPNSDVNPLAGESCSDVSRLSPTQLQERRAVTKSLRYVTESPRADRNCENCQLYIPWSGQACGGCQIFPGPVAPRGYCETWAANIG